MQKKREHKLNSRKKLITKILQASGETYACNQILGNKLLQILAFQLPTHDYFMFILWQNVTLIKQTNKQKSVSKFPLFHATEKSPKFKTKQWAAIQTPQKWGNGFAISLLWLDQRIEAGKRESQKVYSLSLPRWLPSAAFSPRNARDDVVQPVCTEALANPLYLMRLGNQSGAGHFSLSCFSPRPQRGTEERREMFHSFCKYLGQDFSKLASWYPNILSSQKAPAEDPIPFKYCLCSVSDLSLEDTATTIPDQQSSSQGGDAEQNSFPYKRRVSGRVCCTKEYFEGFGCYFLFYTQLSVLVNSANILIFLTSQFFTV